MDAKEDMYIALFVTFFWLAVICIGIQFLLFTLDLVHRQSTRRQQQQKHDSALLEEAREILDRHYSDAEYAYFEDEISKYTLKDYATAQELLNAVFARIEESKRPGIVPSSEMNRRRTVRILGKKLTLPLELSA